MADVSFKNIYKVYPNGTKAVNDFTMDIADKEFIVLVGPSGCGKSTLLRMLAGLEEISAGELKIDDVVVNDAACKDRDTAMVFQNYALYPHMTVAENMMFPLKMTKLTKAEKKVLADEVDAKYPKSFKSKILRPLRISRLKYDKMLEKVVETAKILDLEEYLAKKPGAMSGGQRQRVALGRAMVRNPKVFLLDEPLSNLDAKLRTQMRAEITKLHKRLQTTFVYVTHDQTEAMTMGDRIVVMKKGVVQQIDTPMNLYNYPANLFVAGFIGTPAMNFFDAVVEKQGDTVTVTFANDKKLSCPASAVRKLSGNYYGKKLKMGVRPEHFVLDENGVPCVVTNREVLGSETLLYCDFDTERATDYETSSFGFIVKTEGTCDKVSGDEIRVSLKFDKLHFFDLETEACVNGRLVLDNYVSVKVENGKMYIGKSPTVLPAALQNIEAGEYTAKIPTDAVECFPIPMNTGYEICECEKIGEEYLARVEIDGVSVFARSKNQIAGKVGLKFKMQDVDFYRGEEKVVASLNRENSLPILLEKVKLAKSQIENLPDGELRKFDIKIKCGDIALDCPAAVTIRILSASDRKLFGVPMNLIFNENSIISGNTFTAVVEEVYDFGEKKYALATCMGEKIILPYSGEGESICFDIDLFTASVFDPRVEIKIS